jgi:hypothetical protein
MPGKVGIVDSGVSPGQYGALFASIGIVTTSTGVTRLAAIEDALGHGTAVAEIILAEAPLAQVASAQSFMVGRCADAGCIAEAIGWCLEQDVRVVNLSFGLRHGEAALRCACEAALASGAIVVAASPARGVRPYPAAYPGVIAVSGDARCSMREWSVLEPSRLYGMAPFAADGAARGGASYAAARMSACAARFLTASPSARAEDFRVWLDAEAAFRGRERCATMEFQDVCH